MNRFAQATRLTLAVLTLLGFAGTSVAQAQQPARDLTRFTLTVSGNATPGGIIQTDPPLMTGIITLKGTSDFLGGAVTFTDTHLFHIGVDGTPLRSTNGNGIFAGPNGDALYVTWDAVIRPTDNPDIIQGIAAFTIRGGAGKFAGVVGSGIFNSRINLKTFEVTQVWEGLIAQPKR